MKYRARQIWRMVLYATYAIRYPLASHGSTTWLIGTERKYGGFVQNVPRKIISSKDPREKRILDRGGMQGGDRMFHHGYAAIYSQFLKPYIESGRALTLGEVGILRGSGLAIWCDLFPNSRIMGFDIDLTNTIDNISNIERWGGFRETKPELYEFDQFADNRELLTSWLNGSTFDIFIDDGVHLTESILATLNSAMPHMSDTFVYFIEDNASVHKDIRHLYPELHVLSYGQMTVLTPKS